MSGGGGYFGYLSLSTVLAAADAGAALGVSEVARAPGGFLQAYQDADGRAPLLAPHWRKKREAFLSRHFGQVAARDEPLWTLTRDGMRPTRRHIAIAIWAFSPDPHDLRKWLKQQGYLS